MIYAPEDGNNDIVPRSHEASEHKAEKVGEEEHRPSGMPEIIEALLLALVAILTAWSGYQAARWDGRSALYNGEADADRVLATQYSSMGSQYATFDATTFNAWLAATAQGKGSLAAFYVRRFTPPYRIAFDAWLKTDPLHNPKAPPGPGYMPQYHNPQMGQASRLNNEVSAMDAKGSSASDMSDKYTRVAIVLATVLFLITLSQRFTHGHVNSALRILGVVVVAFALAELVTYPVA
jgi:hypothetical protein